MRAMFRSVLLVVLLLAPTVQGQDAPFLPAGLAPITAANAGDLAQVAQIGRGLVYDLKWRADGEALVVSAATGLWEYPVGADAQKPDAPFLPHDNDRNPGILSADGELEVSRTADGNVQVQNRGGEILMTAETGGTFLWLAISADGSTVAAAPYTADAGITHVWNVADGSERATVALPKYPESISLSADGGILAATETIIPTDSDSYDAVNLYDTATGEKILTLEDERMVVVREMRFSPDGTRLLAGARNAVFLWDATSGDLLRVFENPGAPQEFSDPSRLNYSVNLSPDGTRVAALATDLGRTSGMATSVHLWDAATGEAIPGPDEPMSGYTRQIEFSPDGTKLAYSVYDGTIRVWTVGGALDVLAADHYGSGDTVAVSPDGATLTAGGFDRAVRQYSLATGEPLGEIFHHSGDVQAVTYSPDGSLLATATRFETVLRRDGEIITLDIGYADALAQAFSPDGTTLLGVNFLFGTLTHWEAALADAPESVVKGEFTPPPSADSLAAAYSPDTTMLAVGTADGTVDIYDTETYTLQATFEGEGAVTALEYSPDGSRLVVAHANGLVNIWDTAASAALTEFDAESGVVNDLVFNPAGDVIVTTGADTTVRLWTLDGAAVATLVGHNYEVISAAFTPDGTALISGSWDATIRVWGVR